MSNPRGSVRTCPSFLRTFLVTALALAVLLPLVNLLLIDCSNDPTTIWIQAIARRQHLHALRAATAHPDQPRLLVIGGSASLFGIDCQRIEHTLGVPTVNIAIHAGLGVRYILARAERELRPGDTALLCLEYAACQDEDYCADYRRDTVFTNDRAYLAQIPLPLALFELYTLPVHDYSRTLFSRLDSFLGRRPPPLYPVVTMSPNGDASISASRRIAPLGIHRPDPVLLALVSDFAARCQARNIRVLATWPGAYYGPAGPIPEHLRIADAFRRTYAAASVPVLGNPTDFAFPRTFFADTNYHLNPAGRRIRTERLLGLLVPYFGFPQPPSPADSPLAPIFLIPGPDHKLSPANLAPRLPAGTVFKYLTSAYFPSHSDLLSPADLSVLIRAGRDVFYDDPAAVDPLLPALHLTSAPVAAGQLSFPDLLAQYPNHIFLLSLPPDSPLDSLPGLPANFHALLASPGHRRVAILGTGRYALLSVVATSDSAATLNVPPDARLAAGYRPQIALSLYSGPTARPPLSADATPLLPAGSAASVAVLDPDLDIVLAAHSFPTPTITPWQLRKLQPAP